MNPTHGDIRRAEPGEADALRDLVRAAYAHYVPRLGREPMPMTDDYAARISAGQAWVLDDHGRMIGALILEDTPHGLLIDNIAIAGPARGAGHGRRLMGFAEAEARRRGHARVWLYTNEKMIESIALYAGLGYCETHREVEAGFSRVFMEKPVA